MQILSAHDAADLTFAAIADHQGKLTKTSQKAPPMMECFELISFEDSVQKPTLYFRGLNEARNSLKHIGNLPNTQQWARVGADVYEKLSQICRSCLGLGLDEIDESELLRNDEVKNYLAAAKKAIECHESKKALEEIAKALRTLLDQVPFFTIQVGEAKAEDAIKLSGFGVHANDFLRLQEFLPEARGFGNEFRITWKQSRFGHPGNWREDVVRFCLDAFLQIAPRIQDAKWIPVALELYHLYEYKVTVKEDNVEVWVEGKVLDSGLVTKYEVDRLQKGESRTFSPIHQPLVTDWFDEVERRSFKIVNLREGLMGMIGSILGPSRFVLFDKVTITCVPTTGLMREHFSDLVEIPWSPDEPDRPAE